MVPEYTLVERMVCGWSGSALIAICDSKITVAFESQ